MLTGSSVAAQRTAVDVRAVLPGAQFTSDERLTICAVTERSAECTPGSMFAAIAGTKTDGAKFIGHAIHQGAASLLADHFVPGADVPQCIVADVREAYARLCAATWGQPSRQVQVAGVTGTNGKTTVTWLIRAMLRHADQSCGLLGTVEYDDGIHVELSSLTTPDSQAFSQWLSRMAERQTTHAAVELSSHALHQNRVAGTELAAGVITNITQDHFDYHQNFGHYQASKARIMDLIRPNGVIVLNRDDPGSWGVRAQLPSHVRLVSFSLRDAANVTAQIISESLAGFRFRLAVDGDSVICDSRLIGRHNIENCLAAAAVGRALGVSLADIAEAIREFRGAPGRLERISCGQRFEVFVDYAHTDDALRRCLKSLRSVTPGRVLCVFGAGGDRDRTKRPLLGRAAQLADVPIVTSDNPRSEIPAKIAAEIVAGFASDGPLPRVELDRTLAIRTAMQLARPGDSVLVAGKGHENEQIFRDRRIPFDDRRVAREALLDLISGSSSQRIGA